MVIASILLWVLINIVLLYFVFKAFLHVDFTLNNVIPEKIKGTYETFKFCTKISGPFGKCLLVN